MFLLAGCSQSPVSTAHSLIPDAHKNMRIIKFECLEEPRGYNQTSNQRLLTTIVVSCHHLN